MKSINLNKTSEDWIFSMYLSRYGRKFNIFKGKIEGGGRGGDHDVSNRVVFGGIEKLTRERYF